MPFDLYALLGALCWLSSPFAGAEDWELVGSVDGDGKRKWEEKRESN